VGAAATVEEIVAIAEGGRSLGKIEGLRLAVEKLLKRAADAREVGDEFEGKCLEEAAVMLGNHATADGGRGMSASTEEDIEQSIELAGELALEWCRVQVAEVKAIFPNPDGRDAFRNGFETACEEIQERIKTKRFSAILEETVTKLEK